MAKYGPPALMRPLVAMALRDSDVRTVVSTQQAMTAMVNQMPAWPVFEGGEEGVDEWLVGARPPRPK